jgi:hypothetical protein
MMKNKANEKALRPWSPGIYQIKVDGYFHENWLDLCAGMRVTIQKREDESIVTCLTGQIKDQSHLLGLLNSLADLHFPILFVKHID